METYYWPPKYCVVLNMTKFAYKSIHYRESKFFSF